MIRKLFMLAITQLFFCSSVGAAQTTLEGTIEAIPIFPPTSTKNQIKPGSLMQLLVKVSNIGDAESKPGAVFLRFLLPKEIKQGEDSLFFTTEKENLPSLSPGESAEIAFTTHHQWPTLYDFIRFDWGMRHYEAVAIIGEQEKVIATMRITFTADYYPGYIEERPQQFD